MLRAEPKAETERRLLEAAKGLFLERPYPEVRLEDFAAAAGVRAPTVIHRYGSKEALLAAAVRSMQEEVEMLRVTAPGGAIALEDSTTCLGFASHSTIPGSP